MNRLFQLRIFFSLWLLGVVLFTALPALAATVTLRAPTVEAQAGSTVDVPIQAAGATNLGALHVELVYDARVLTPDTVTRGSLAGSNALVDSNPGTPGRLLIGLATLDAIKGDGPVAVVRFKAVGDAGASSPLSLENSKAWESGSHAEILVKTEAGKVIIAAGLPGWLIPLLVAVAALVLLFIIFFLFMRRRRREPQPAVAQPVYNAPPLPSSMPAPRARAATMPPLPMDLPESQARSQSTPGASAAFKQAEDEYYRLKGRFASGRITRDEFESALKESMVKDAQGRYWTLGVDTGKWYVNNGQSWVEGQPY